MTDDVHERIGFREIDEEGNAVRAVNPHAPEPADSPRKGFAVNPFILGLWVLELGLVWFCGWIMAETIRPTPTTAVASDGMPLNFLLVSTLPFALLTAVLLLAGLLFWHAAQWQKKRSTRS